MSTVYIAPAVAGLEPGKPASYCRLADKLTTFDSGRTTKNRTFMAAIRRFK